MKMMKQMACAALVAAVAVGITGCGNKNSSTGSFQPKVAEGAIAALVVRPMEDTSLAPLCKQYGLGMTDLMKQASGDALEIIKELELDKAETKWIAVTFDAVSAEKIEKGEPDFAVVAATSVDLDKIVALIKKKAQDNKVYVNSHKFYSGIKDKFVQGYEVRYVLDKMGGGMDKICMASLGNKLLVVANTDDGVLKQLALYNTGKGASADFGSFVLGANDVIRLKVAKVGENMKKALPDPGMLKMVNGVIPDGDKIVQGLGAVELAFGASDDGKKIKLDLSLDTAADADADKLVTFAKTGLMNLTAQMKEGAEKNADAKATYEALQAVKIEAKGKVAALAASTAADAALKALADKAKELK